jgi:excisionase family DNA binding protein
MSLGPDPLLSLREVAVLTDTRLPTVRRWVREHRLDVERIGPTRRIRVRWSVVIALFPHVHRQAAS